MLKNKKGEWSLIAVITLLFSSVLMVSAVVVNTTEILNFSPIPSDSIINLSLPIESTINSASGNFASQNLTIPIGNQPSLNQTTAAVNDTINLILPPQENLTAIDDNKPLLNTTISNQTDTIMLNQGSNLSEIAISANLSNFTISQSAITAEKKNISLPKLAKLFNEDNMEFDKEYKENYLDYYKNFTDLNYKKIIGSHRDVLKIGAKNEKIVGYEINGSYFAVDLLSCNSYEKYCAFRINGVPTKKLSNVKGLSNSKRDSFDLDKDYVMKIESIEFDFCDERRFCHLGYEGYHIVNISIERKK